MLPLSQEAACLGDISYHDYRGILVDPAEKEVLARNLGPVNKVMMLRNHGVVCCGETVEESWYLTYYTTRACEIQVSFIGFFLSHQIDSILLFLIRCKWLPSASTI